VLELALSQIPRFGGEIRSSVSVPSFHENFDSDRSVITNPEIETEIRASLALLLADG
jgi:chromate reductase